MNLAAKLRMLVEWMPVLAAAQGVVLSPAGSARVRSALQMLDLVADKTKTPEDDELVELLKRVAMTTEGALLIDWISDKVQALFPEEELDDAA